MSAPRICFVGLENLPAISRDYGSIPAGGEQVQQTLLARALARRGYPVSMVTVDLGQPQPLSIDGVEMISAYRPKAGIAGLRFAHPRWTGVMSALARARADVYYTSCAGISVAQIVLAARSRGASTVFRVASDTDCEPDRLLIKYWRDRKIYEWGLRRIDRVLAQSQYQQGLMKRNYGIDASLSYMLVEPGDASRPFAARDCDVLWVSNIRQLKRPDRYLDLARALPQLRLELIGGPQPGAEALYEEMRSQAASIPNLNFRGLVPYHEVGGCFARTKVFVNTSEIEGFPNSYLQAWTHGVPVVAHFDPDGTIRREGLGFAARDAREMREAVQRLCTDRGAWQRTSERCRAFMARHYSEDTILEPYLSVFEQQREAHRARTA